jgi:hypothetical protein
MKENFKEIDEGFYEYQINIEVSHDINKERIEKFCSYYKFNIVDSINTVDYTRYTLSYKNKSKMLMCYLIKSKVARFKKLMDLMAINYNFVSLVKIR